MPFEYSVKLFKNLGKSSTTLEGFYHSNILNFIYRPIKLVVAKCWDPNPKGYFTIPRTEPVRPIDPGAWVAHTEAARGACLFIIMSSYRVSQ